MTLAVIIAEAVMLAFSLVLTFRLKTTSGLKRLGGFMLYFLLINALAFIIAFAIDKIAVMVK